VFKKVKLRKKKVIVLCLLNFFEDILHLNKLSVSTSLGKLSWIWWSDFRLDQIFYAAPVASKNATQMQK
jgi:hypothetical protein